MRIKLINQSTMVTPAEHSKAARVCAKQVSQWRRDWNAQVSYINLDPKKWDAEIVLLDNADQADALGYHDVDPNGRPYGKVFIQVCKQYGYPWVSVLSHEVLELLGDPGANQWANDPTGRLWAFEMCDAIQDHIYPLDGEMVSNYVLPNFFIPGAPGPYDFMGKLTAPFTIAGGYSIVARVTQVSQIYGAVRGQATDIVGDRQLAQRPDKKHPTARTYRRLHAFEQGDA